jgi:hypothetical protein
MRVEDVLECQLGSIVAPAGCGKTHLITQALSIGSSKPTLVLTHTTAGVAALKKRLRQLSIPASHYVVTTIDGWALKVVGSFPLSCPIFSSPEKPRDFYPEIRQSVLRFLLVGGIHDVIRSTYSRLLVDEYQDCDINQHNLVSSLSEVIPTVIFGDPMQCIFDFSGRMPDWYSEVLSRFPPLGTMNIPWRWNNAGTQQLGEWVLFARERFLLGESVDLRSCPGYVAWYQLTGNSQIDLISQRNIQHTILNQNPTGSLLVIGSSINEQSRHLFAKGSFRTEVVEPVQLGSVTGAASQFDKTTGLELVAAILEVASTMMTNVEKVQVSKRIESILNSRNKTAPSPVEYALCTAVTDSTRSNILAALQQIELKPGVNVYRRAAYNALKDSISLAISSPTKSMFEAASIVRERMRQQGDGRIPFRAIGSTLLLKGLEADHCLILDANGKGMNPKHLYVALSRGAKTVSVFSNSYQIG